MKLSRDFALSEFLVSESAARHGIDMKPPVSVVNNLRRLCETILQPLRDELDSPVIITSGYRPKALNTLIGGSEKSQHITGEAADIRVLGYSPVDVFVHAEELDLPINQLINEFGQWVHISIAPRDVPEKRQLLTAVRRDGKTVYLNGLQA
jgi:hypothetical protein